MEEWGREVKGAEAIVKNPSVVRSLSIARTRCGRDEFYTLRRSYHLTPFHSRGISMAVCNSMVCVGHEADRSRDPRGHNETRSTLTENGTELTMSTNLQLSLRQLAPIECRRRPFRPPRETGPTFPSSPLLASFLFPRAHGLGSSRRWKPSRHVHAIAASELHGCRMNFH